jgi:hypothetical protein
VRATVALLALVLALGAALVLLAPTERTLGTGIRVIYVHVALIWTGMLGLIQAGVIGLIVLLWRQQRLVPWLMAVGKVAVGFYALSAVVSMVAQEVNWGAISWREPRTVAMLQMLALAVIVLVLASWVKDVRLRGFLFVVLALAIVWSWQVTPLQLHPRDPVGTSSSPAIRLTFYGLFGLCALVATWLVFFLVGRERTDEADVLATG